VLQSLMKLGFVTTFETATMRILGISAWYHDSAAALVVDGKIVAASQEERFTRKKHDASFPSNAVRFCLESAGVSTTDLDAIVFYDKGLLKFERLIETYYSFSPKGVRSFIKSMPVWLNEKLFLKRNLRREISKIGKLDRAKTKMLFSEHHLSHAASAFYCSPFENSAVLTVDGVGEWATASIYKGQGNQLTSICEMNFPHSVGLLYSSFTYWLGFAVNSGEYKLMGLAPYGNKESTAVKHFEQKIRKHLLSIHNDGSIWLNSEMFSYATGLRMVNDRKWEVLFGFPRRNSEDTIEQHHCDLAFALQQVTEEIILLMAKEAKKRTGADNICLAGGVALNCVANGKLSAAGLFKGIYIQPGAGDSGGAIGAALAAYHISFMALRNTDGINDSMSGAQLGPEYTVLEISAMISDRNAVAERYENYEELSKVAAGLIANDKVIGWFQGRMEFGPRALGNRSILGNPLNENLQRIMNAKIKNRESFRPFAPSVLDEDVSTYFEINHDSPYMLLVAPLKEKYRMPLPNNYMDLPMMERVYVTRSVLPAITHVDFTSRIQTVNADSNKRYFQLLKSFKAITGYGILVNTSFNVRGEPLVCTPDDAYRCFMRTEMDYLVIGDFLLSKVKQPHYDDRIKWKEEFTLD